jgi:phosphate transport system substrate-binding protein
LGCCAPDLILARVQALIHKGSMPVSRALNKFRPILLALLFFFRAAPGKADDEPAPVKIQSVTALKSLLSDAAGKLKEEGIPTKPKAGGASADLFAQLGEGEIDLALTLRSITPEERANYPEKEFREYELGKQAIVLIIPEILWTNGIKALTREQVQGIYEGRFTNWNQLGGPNRSIKFFNPVRGQSVWEMFAAWLYSDEAKAAPGHFETVENGENAAATVQFNSGALSVAYIRWANQKDVFAVPIKEDNGAVVAPTLENIASGKYPLSRTIYLAETGKPLGDRRSVIDYFTGPEGRKILLRNDIIPTTMLAGKSVSAK